MLSPELQHLIKTVCPVIVDPFTEWAPSEDALCSAVEHGSLISVFNVLTTSRRSLDKPGEDELIHPGLTHSPILTAIEKDRADIVSLLLAVTRKKSAFPVLDAIQCRSTGSLDAFLWHGWDINSLTAFNEPSAFGYAIQSKTLVTWFLEHGADPNAGIPSDTPLSRAAFAGSVEVIRLLLSNGGDVLRGDVLHWAVQRDDEYTVEVMTLLLEEGAPPNQVRFDGIAPQWSVYDVDGHNPIGTALHTAASLGRSDLVTVLLKHGADPGVKDTNGNTAEQLARKAGHDNIITLLKAQKNEGSEVSS